MKSIRFVDCILCATAYGKYSKYMGIFSKDTKEDVKEEEKATETTAAAVPAVNLQDLKDTGDAYEVLVRPIISEKASLLAEQGKYTFEVAWNANRSMVKNAIYKVYGVKPRQVNIITMKGKAIQFRRVQGKRNDWKKAIVTLPEGKSLEIYEGV